MEKITRDICKNQNNGKFKSTFTHVITIEILLTFGIWLKSNSIWWLLFCVTIFGTLTVMEYFALRKTFHVVSKNSEFYIVEDVLINSCEINAFANRFRRYIHYYDYEICFSKNGIYQLSILSKKEPKETDADYSAVFFSQPGDKFYILMSSVQKKQSIIKTFNAKYYKLVEDDFDYIDGKYYPKI